MYCPICGAQNSDNAFMCSKCNANLTSIYLQDIQLSPYVDFRKRFTAWAIDAVILYVIGFFYIFLLISVEPELSIISIALSSIVIDMIYFAGFESSKKQATPGKQSLGIKVTDLEGNRISFGKAFFRYVLKLTTELFFGVGYLAIVFSEKKQGLYDMAVGTVVVYK